MIQDWKGKWALITGASAGIGSAFARELAAGGANLILTARRRDRLESWLPLAARCSLHPNRNRHRGSHPLVAPQEIFAFTESKQIQVSLLINNAGFGQYGELPTVDTQRLLDMVQVNCHAVVHLTDLPARHGPAPLRRRPHSRFHRSFGAVSAADFRLRGHKSL